MLCNSSIPNDFIWKTAGMHIKKKKNNNVNIYVKMLIISSYVLLVNLKRKIFKPRVFLKELQIIMTARIKYNT